MHPTADDITTWLDARLAEARLRRTGPVACPHDRPWATVLRAETDDGAVWLKCCAPATAFEAGAYEVLARVVPELVLRPLALDLARGWILLPDGGPTLGELLVDPGRAERLASALATYGELQRALAPHAGELLARGVPDMRPAAMPARLDEAIAAVGPDTDAGREALRRRDEMAGWCARLAASPLPPSLDHNDLHPWNVLPGEDAAVRFYDWGDAVVAHPFAAALVPLGLVHRALGDEALARARDGYLAAFADLAPRDELVATLELACRVAKIARTLTWVRALQAARDAGEELPERFADAPRATLASALDDWWLGGA